MSDDSMNSSNRAYSDQGSSSSESSFHNLETIKVSVTETSLTNPSINNVFHDFDSLEYDHEYDVKYTNRGADMYAEESLEENFSNDPPSPSVHILEASLLYLLNEYSIPLTSYK